MSALSEFEKPDTLVHVGLIGGLVELDFRQELLLLLAPVLRYLVVEISIDPAIQFVHVHGV